MSESEGGRKGNKERINKVVEVMGLQIWDEELYRKTMGCLYIALPGIFRGAKEKTYIRGGRIADAQLLALRDGNVVLAREICAIAVIGKRDARREFLEACGRGDADTARWVSTGTAKESFIRNQCLYRESMIAAMATGCLPRIIHLFDTMAIESVLWEIIVIQKHLGMLKTIMESFTSFTPATIQMLIEWATMSAMTDGIALLRTLQPKSPTPIHTPSETFRSIYPKTRPEAVGSIIQSLGIRKIDILSSGILENPSEISDAHVVATADALLFTQDEVEYVEVMRRVKKRRLIAQ